MGGAPLKLRQSYQECYEVCPPSLLTPHNNNFSPSLYRLVHENNVPGVYIPFAPFHYRLFVWTPRFFRVASVDTQVKEGVVEKAPRKRRKGFFSYVPFVYLGRAYYKVKWMMGLSPRTRKERTYEGEREMERQREKEMQKETTKKPDWMKGMRDIAEDTYKHVMDAIATYVPFFSPPLPHPFTFLNTTPPAATSAK